ncbi:unnamed protein product [Acanthosepion pharaonis]|uniref:Uncharacterized protein n=1 Tax=Acanthosepion pharaonis TaxID=158019 RepID=A0A812ENG4_ACAPH|nr:unnamed protein product [Sepia pharaonis]
MSRVFAFFFLFSFLLFPLLSFTSLLSLLALFPFFFTSLRYFLFPSFSNLLSFYLPGVFSELKLHIQFSSSRSSKSYFLKYLYLPLFILLLYFAYYSPSLYCPSISLLSSFANPCFSPFITVTLFYSRPYCHSHNGLSQVDTFFPPLFLLLTMCFSFSHSFSQTHSYPPPHTVITRIVPYSITVVIQRYAPNTANLTCLSLSCSIYLSIYLSIHLSIYLSICYVYANRNKYKTSFSFSFFLLIFFVALPINRPTHLQDIFS